MATKGDISDLDVLKYGGKPLVPLIEGFNRYRKSGVTRSDVAGGASRQRKKYYGTTHIAQVTFDLASPMAMDFIQIFINRNEGKKFICYLAADRPIVEPYVVQAIDDWDHNEVNAVEGRVSVALEIFSARSECLDEFLNITYSCVGDDVCEWIKGFSEIVKAMP